MGVFIARRFPKHALWNDDATALLKPDGGSLNTQALQALVGLGVQPVSILSATPVPLGLFGQLADGRYLCYDFYPGGGGRQRLALYDGDPTVDYSTDNVTPLTQCDSRAPAGLLNTSGAAIDYTAATIYHAWVAPNGDVFFVVVETGNFFHLYRAKAGTFTVGSDAGYTNKQAILSIGAEGGVHSAFIRVFCSRSLLFAKVGTATHIYMCEYNVSPGRTSGAGGAGHDQVIAWKSTDGGETWTEFLKFNTAGSHVTDHLHGATQDPYTGWIYFMFGDNGAENALIAYDGVSSPPAANSTFAQIHTTAGFRVISGSELHRYTDLCFGPQTVYSVPDADAESSDTGSIAYVSTVMPKTLDYVASVAPVARLDNVPPAINLQTSGRAALCLSFLAGAAVSAGNPYIDLWSADSEGGSWTLIGRFTNQKAGASGVLRSLFEDSQGRVWLGGTNYGSGFSFVASHDNNNYSSSMCLTLGQRAGAGTLFEWPGA